MIINGNKIVFYKNSETINEEFGDFNFDGRVYKAIIFEDFIKDSDETYLLNDLSLRKNDAEIFSKYSILLDSDKNYSIGDLLLEIKKENNSGVNFIIARSENINDRFSLHCKLGTSKTDAEITYNEDGTLEIKATKILINGTPFDNPNIT